MTDPLKRVMPLPLGKGTWLLRSSLLLGWGWGLVPYVFTLNAKF